MNTEAKIIDDTKWFHPLTATPENGEIVVIACDIVHETDQGRAVSQIFQTAIYEVREDKTEAWHCGQPFVMLRYWLRLPTLPVDTIVQVKKQVIL